MHVCFTDVPCKFSAKILSGFGEEADFGNFFFILLLLVTTVILDPRPGPVLQFDTLLSSRAFCEL